MSRNDIEDPILSETQKLTKRKALGHIFDLSLFTMASMFLSQSYDIVNTIYLGWADNQVINQASKLLGTVAVNMFVMAFSFTFNGALSTLVAQAYGQKDFRLCAIYLNRQLYINAIIFLCLSVIFVIFSECIFIWMDVDTTISKLASDYITYITPGLFFSNFHNCLMRYLAGQREMRFNFYASLLALIIHSIMAYVLVFKYDMGLYGIGISTCIHFFNRFIFLYIIVKFSRFNEHLVSLFDQDCFSNWKQQMALGAQATLMQIWVWWSFDIFAIFASMTDPNIMSALLISRQIIIPLYMAPVGFQVAASALVGNMIGEENIKDAKLYFSLTNLCGIFYGFFCVILLSAFPYQIVSLYSLSTDIVFLVTDINYLLAFFMLVDSIQGVYQGVITGLGKQGKAAIFTIISFWVIGVPSTLLYIHYYQVDMFGLWIGMTIGTTVIVGLYYQLLVRSDWHQIAEEAKQRRLNDKKNDEN